MESSIINTDRTIVAISTPPGTGGIAVIRMSGPDAFKIADKVWKGKSLSEASDHTAHYGAIKDPENGVLDRVVATVFRGPASYTGEDTVEIACHGSKWIQRELVNLLIRHGASAAEPGEFSKRAYLNGRLDLAQTEGVMDLISASSRAAHKLAMMQTDGRFSRRLDDLRLRLIDFASLLELELDFSEEDVEFADRSRLRELSEEIISDLAKLASSYAAGRAFKEGLPVVIAGVPNAGKSTILNSLLESDKAIVSDIPGTTRDIIEDTRELGGVLFRFVDTAGLRSTEDAIEKIGISRAAERIAGAAILLWTIDPSADIPAQLEYISRHLPSSEAINVLVVNKTDLLDSSKFISEESFSILSDKSLSLNHDITQKFKKSVFISGLTGEGISSLIDCIVEEATEMQPTESDIMITNARHYDSILRGKEDLERARYGIDTGLSADLIAQDVRSALHHLATITGSITTPTLLHSIFSRFCIGK